MWISKLYQATYQVNTPKYNFRYTMYFTFLRIENE